MKQIVVTCNKCKDLLAISDDMEIEEAEKLASKLKINPFGAPKCSVCKIEPFDDINLMHTIEIKDFNKDLKIK